MKIIRKRGDTSNILQVFIQDSSSTTGAGLTGLAFNSASLTAYYHRDVDTTATAITLVTMTVGTFTSSGFKEIDATNMPGWYQLCPPDAAFSATSTPHSVGIALKGATNMMPLNIEIQLIAADVEDTVRLGLTAMPNVASGSAGAIVTSGTGAAQITTSSGQVTVATNNDKTGYSIASGGIGSGAHSAAELNNIADAQLDRIMSAGVDSGGDNTTARTVRQALRTCRNKVNISAGTMTVYKEDDTTSSYTAAITTSAGNPITTVDPT